MSKSIEYGALDNETVADLLDVSTRQLSNYCKLKGLPSHGEGKRRTFVWAEVREWWYDYRKSMDRDAGSGGNGSSGNDDDTSVPDKSHSEARKEKYLADTRELELQKKLGQLVPIDDVARVLQDTAKGLQTEILGLPSKIVEQVLAIRDRTELFNFLTVTSNDLCTRLSTLRIGSAADIAAPDPTPEDDDE